MPIDMDNMLPGFSPQLMCAAPTVIDPAASAATAVIAANPLRDAEVLDVGFLITDSSASAYTIKIGLTTPSGINDDYFVTDFEVTAAANVGVVYRIADGNLSWAGTADTEAERVIPKGSHITIHHTDAGDAGADAGGFVPFVIMRGAEPLDPIA